MAQAPDRSEGTSAGKRDVKEIARLVIGVVGLVLLIAFLIAAVLGVLVDRLVIAVGKRRRKQR